MKKMTALLFVVAIIFAAPAVMAFPTIHTNEIVQENWTFWGDGHTYMYTSIVDFYYCQPDYFFGGVWLGTMDGLPNSLSWDHTLPSDLQVPPDEVLRARLWIDAAFVGTDGNEIQIQGLVNWDPLNNQFWDNSTYWLSSVEDQGFWNDGSINVNINAGEYYLRVDMAILMLDYQNNDGQAPPAVPEPATVALLGLGLFGIGVFQHRRLKRQS